MNEWTINSYWSNQTGRWSEEQGTYIDEKRSPEKEKLLKIKIDYYKNDYIIRFIDGPTGYESYYVNDLLAKVDNKEGKFYICAGTINSWSTCYVLWKDLKPILKEISESLYSMDK